MARILILGMTLVAAGGMLGGTDYSGNDSGRDANLLAAVRADDFDQVVAALKNGANPNAKGPDGFPILFLATPKTPLIITALLAAGANPDSQAPDPWSKTIVDHYILLALPKWGAAFPPLSSRIMRSNSWWRRGPDAVPCRPNELMEFHPCPSIGKFGSKGLCGRLDNLSLTTRESMRDEIERFIPQPVPG